LELLKASLNNRALTLSRAKTKDALIEKAKRNLDKIRSLVGKRALKGKDKIWLAVGEAIAKEKMGKHFIFAIGERSFKYSLDAENIEKEKALRGVRVIRVSLPVASISAAERVRLYRSLAKIKRSFRSMAAVSPRV
jgi:hypothetical protein